MGNPRTSSLGGALLLALLAFSFSATTLASSDTHQHGHDCTHPAVRREWRDLSPDDRQAYIAAVKCLQEQPGHSSFPGVRSRYDDFQAEHINQTDYIHFVGQFQPWHRVFVARYESDLRSLCGWTGGQPYWDWSRDSDSVEAFLAAPVFDPETGFGGNGPYVDTSEDPSVRIHLPAKTGGGCIQDGPFRDRQVSMGPGANLNYTPHCLRRDFSPAWAITQLNHTLVDWVLDATDFFEFDRRVEGKTTSPDSMSYHGGGHLGVGGEIGDMQDIYASPGDPIFYLHHSNMDRLWYKWQQKDWERRKADIGGPDTQFAYPFNFQGEVLDYRNITLDYVIDFHKLLPEAPLVRVGDVMDPQAGPLCYTFE